jgi:hypothetical protein
MLDYIVITTTINIIEALQIRHYGLFKKAYYSVNGMKTYEVKEYGIKEISLWADTKKAFIEPVVNKNCIFSVTLDGVELLRESIQDYEVVIKRVEEFLPKGFERRGKLEWKVKSASFIYNFTGYNIYEYYMLLRSGYDLANLNMEKVTQKIKSEEGEIYNLTFSAKGRKNSTREILEKQKKDSIFIEAELDYRNRVIGAPECVYEPIRIKKDRLQIKINVKKKKMIQLCKDCGVENRDFLQFMKNLNLVESQLFSNYVGRIAGCGDYYRYEDAEKIILASKHTKNEKEKMLATLKGVASYKGISNFLNHVEDVEVRYDCMKLFSKREYAQTALRNLQKLGINPMNLSIRNDKVSGKLRSLIDIYADINPYQVITDTTIGLEFNGEAVVDISDGEECPFD